MISRTLYLILLLMTASGCSNFENPLPWEESPLSETLLGDWQTTTESETPFLMTVTRTEDINLSFRLDFDEDENGSRVLPAFVLSDDAISASFSANLLVSNGVHVLQIDANSYVEEDESDDEKETRKRSGYRFARILTLGETTEVQLLDIGSFSRLAEDVLATLEITLSIQHFADCLEDDAVSFVVMEALKEGVEEGAIKLLLEEDWAELEELEELLVTRAREKVKPYEEIQEMRECIAYKLSGYELGRLFENHADNSFSGESFMLKKVD